MASDSPGRAARAAEPCSSLTERANAIAMTPDPSWHGPGAPAPASVAIPERDDQGRRMRTTLAMVLVLIAFNLRTPVTSVAPVLREASQATGLSATGASLLTMAASFCFGLFGPLGPWLSGLLGLERAILAALGALVVGTALRGEGASVSLFAGQILSCGGIGVINVLLPSLIKRDFPSRVAFITGLYVMSMSVGAALAAGATVPAEKLLGSWAAALSIWAVPALVATLAWLTQRAAPREETSTRTLGWLGLAADRLAWQVTLFMGLQSALAYIVFGWLAPILRDRGLPPVEAGLALSISIVGQACASLVAPSLAMLGKDQRPAIVALSLLSVVSLLACFYAPLDSVWLWSILLGVGQGGLFPIALMLIVLRTPDALLTRHLSSMAQGVGYILASTGPLLAGLLHGSRTGLTILVLSLGAVMLLAGYGAGRALQIKARHRS
jgi:CP family cyanate transporter-like MFS transporter